PPGYIHQSRWAEGSAYGDCFRSSAMGEKQQALERFSECLRISDMLGDLMGKAEALTYLGESYHELGNPLKAAQCSREASSRYRRIAFPLGESRALMNLAKISEERGNFHDALTIYGQALELFKKGGDPFQEALSLNAIGRVHHRMGEVSA